MINKVLTAWLNRVDARLLWSRIVGQIGEVKAYQINGRLALVLLYSRGHGSGFELFVPASRENNTAATLDGAATALGVDGSRGLHGPDEDMGEDIGDRSDREAIED